MEKRTRPYEVLVRIQPDGTAAAHVRKIEEIVDGDVVVAANELMPEPLSLAGPEFDALLPSLDQAILAQNASLLEERAELQATLETVTARCEALTAENTALMADPAATGRLPRDRIEGGAAEWPDTKAGETEITTEMVEAGEGVVGQSTGGWDLGGYFSASELAVSVYRAMEAARRGNLERAD